MGKLIVLPVMFVAVIAFWSLVIYALKGVFGALLRTRRKADLYDVRERQQAEASLRAKMDETRELKEALAELLAERRERQTRDANPPPRRAA